MMLSLGLENTVGQCSTDGPWTMANGQWKQETKATDSECNANFVEHSIPGITIAYT